MDNGVTELAVLFEATRKEIIEQAGAHLLEFYDYHFRLGNRLIHCIQYCRYAQLFDARLWKWKCKPQSYILGNMRNASSCSSSLNPAKVARQLVIKKTTADCRLRSQASHG
jgi:hypothetical protein